MGADPGTSLGGCAWRVVVDHQDDLMTATIAGRMITARVGCVDGAGPGMDAVGAALLADAVWSLRRVF